MREKYILHINYLVERQVLSNELNYRGKVSHDINNMLSLTVVHGCLRGRKGDLARFYRLKEGQRRQKRTFGKEWAAKLAESDKGAFYNQEKLLDELDRDHKTSEQAEMSASRNTIVRDSRSRGN